MPRLPPDVRVDAAFARACTVSINADDVYAVRQALALSDVLTREQNPAAFEDG